MRKILHKVHLWGGLTLCVPLVLLGLSGSLSVVAPQLEGLFATPVVSAEGPAHAIDDMLEAARAQAPEGFEPNFYRPAEAGGLASVFLMQQGRKGGEGGKKMMLQVDPVTLTVAAADSGGFLRLVAQYHSSLLLRDFGGRSVVGWFGVALFLFGVTGLVLWWPDPGRWRKAFQIRRKSKGWRFHRELHGAAGIWGVLMLLFASISGIYLAFPRSIEAGLQTVSSFRDMRASPTVVVTSAEGHVRMSAEAAATLAREAVTGTHLVSVGLPRKSDQPYRVALLRDGDAEGHPPVTVFVDPWAKYVIEIRDPRAYSFMETLMAWAHSAHEGQGLGWFWKMLVFFTGFLPLLFVVTGLSMWQIKKRTARSGRQGPITKRKRPSRKLA